MFTEEQKLIFQSLHNRSVTDQNEKCKLPKFSLKETTTKSDDKKKEELKRLFGYPVKTELDRKLILGVFDTPKKQKKKEISALADINFDYQSHSYSNNHDLTSSFSQMIPLKVKNNRLQRINSIIREQKK